MKKIFLVVLILFFVSLSVFSSEEYEGWDKWDEELPPANSEKWHWHWGSGATKINYNFSEYEGVAVFLTTATFYYGGTSPFEGQVSVLFYSTEDRGESREDWKISDSALAIAVFPPIKNKVMVRAYQKDADGRFKCFESWKIKFKQYEQKDIVSLKRKFSKVLREWFFDSIAKVQRDKKDMNTIISKILPRIEIMGEAIQLFPKLTFPHFYYPDENEG